MKRFIFALSLFVPAICSAASTEDPFSMSVASYTASNETTARLGTTKPGDILETVNVGKASAGGTLTLFDTQGQSGTKIAVIDLATVQSYLFHVKVSSGISYTTASNSSGVTITYRQR